MTVTLSKSMRFRSPLRYPGGKQRAISAIAQFLPSCAREYREPLVGGGSVYFYSKSINLAKNYWINDAFKELISFWKTTQNPSSCKTLVADLMKIKKQYLSARELKDFYNQVRLENPQDSYRQALLFFFFNRVSFSGTTNAGGFSKAASLLRFTDSSIKRVSFMPEALAQTKITNLDFEEVIAATGSDVFLFLDPPYLTAKKLYGKNGLLHSFDHKRLADCLRQTQHKFLITYGDCDEIRHLYKWANIRTWTLQYGMNNCNLERESKIGCELFISNY